MPRVSSRSGPRKSSPSIYQRLSAANRTSLTGGPACRGRRVFRCAQETARVRGQHLWERGYFCATVGAVDEQTVMVYIESQKWDQDNEGFKVVAPTSLAAEGDRHAD